VTTAVGITNQALQMFGSRTTIASLSENSNEAIQASLSIYTIRDALLRMAPWDCATNFANLIYITSAPGTPENTTAGPTTWAKGVPPPQWAYEYQYPADCIRMLRVVPQFVTGFAGGIPITPVVTGYLPFLMAGPAVKFKIGVDQFFAATAAAIAAGGTGHAVGDIITLAGTPTNTAPIGAPAQVRVTAVAAGVITAATVVGSLQQITPADEVISGSYFSAPTNPVAQGSTTGSGIGATFNLTMNTKSDQRVIFTNQQSAIACYVKQITDPNVMDPQLLSAWIAALAGKLSYQLNGDKQTANMMIGQANALILAARVSDGNEGLTINDHTPDWIRTRGYAWGEAANDTIPIDWGGVFPYF
jgi:hypothetical protein